MLVERHHASEPPRCPSGRVRAADLSQTPRMPPSARRSIYPAHLALFKVYFNWDSRAIREGPRSRDANCWRRLNECNCSHSRRRERVDSAGDACTSRSDVHSSAPRRPQSVGVGHSRGNLFDAETDEAWRRFARLRESEYPLVVTTN
jgi:hypothetical protein